MERGIDVSSNNGTVDWRAVASAGFTFAYARATLGRESNDTAFEANRAGAKAHGIRFGAYHLPYPGNSSGAQQAQHLLSVAKPQPGDLLPAIDIEGKTPPDDGEARLSRDQLVAWFREWLTAVEQALGGKPVIYTNPSWWKSRLQNADLTAYPLWLAHYTQAPAPDIPGPWTRFAIWQHAQDGHIGGRAFDFNRCPDLVGVTVGGAVHPLLQLGSRGPAVVRLKKLLTAWCATNPPPAGFRANNVFGQGAVDVVMRFQRAHNLDPDGKVGDKTWKALEPGKPQPTRKPAAVKPKPAAAKPKPAGAQPPSANAIPGSAHFTFAEVLTKSGYDVLPPDIKQAAVRHAKNMEILRSELNRLRKAHDLPETGLAINSWARSPAHNKEVGGAAKSRHLAGDACDITLQEIDRICSWTGGRKDFDAVADRVFAQGGFGTYPGGNRHVDSRGTHARWSTWTPG